jgi:hypothetical protein
MYKLLLALVLLVGTSICVTGCTSNNATSDKTKPDNKDTAKAEKPKQEGQDKPKDPPSTSPNKETDKPEKEEVLYKGKPAKAWARQLKDRDVALQLDALSALKELGKDADNKECIQALIDVGAGLMTPLQVKDGCYAVLLNLPAESTVVALAKQWKKEGAATHDYERLAAGFLFVPDSGGLTRREAYVAIPALTKLLGEAVKAKDGEVCERVARLLLFFDPGTAKDAVPSLEQAKLLCEGQGRLTVERAIKKHGGGSQ